MLLQVLVLPIIESYQITRRYSSPKAEQQCSCISTGFGQLSIITCTTKMLLGANPLLGTWKLTYNPTTKTCTLTSDTWLMIWPVVFLIAPPGGSSSWSLAHLTLTYGVPSIKHQLEKHFLELTTIHEKLIAHSYSTGSYLQFIVNSIEASHAKVIIDFISRIWNHKGRPVDFVSWAVWFPWLHAAPFHIRSQVSRAVPSWLCSADGLGFDHPSCFIFALHLCCLINIQKDLPSKSIIWKK